MEVLESLRRNSRIVRIAAVCVASFAWSPASAGAQEIKELSIVGSQDVASAPANNPDVSIGKSRKICKEGFQTGGPALFPYVDGPDAQTPAAIIKIKKRCRGPVLATFNSAVRAPGEDDALKLSLIARCVGPSGFANGCEKGAYYFAGPSGYGMSLVTGPIPFETTYSMQWVFADLLPGFWKFEVHPSSQSETVELRGRSFAVQAFNNG